MNLEIVVAEELAHDLIIGTDAMTKNGFKLDFGSNSFEILGDRKESHVASAREIILEPFEQQLVWGNINDALPESCYAIQSTDGEVPCIVTVGKDGRVPLLVSNLSITQTKIEKGQILAPAFKVDIVDRQVCK